MTHVSDFQPTRIIVWSPSSSWGASRPAGTRRRMSSDSSRTRKPSSGGATSSKDSDGIATRLVSVDVERDVSERVR